jgi:hypothetical protein
MNKKISPGENFRLINLSNPIYWRFLMKKGLSVILAVCILSSGTSCSPQSTIPTRIDNQPTARNVENIKPTIVKPTNVPTIVEPTDEPTALPDNITSDFMPYDEIERGKWYGFIPADFQGDLDQPIVFSNFGSLLSNMLLLIDKDGETKWEVTAKDALQKTETMKREDGLLMLFYAADSVGLTKLNAHPAGQWAVLNDKMGPDNWWRYLTYKYPYFSNSLDNYPGGWEGQDFDYVAAAFFFSIGEQSFISGKSLLDYDPESNSMRSQDPFTQREAIQSVVRLYEALIFNKFVPFDSADRFTISPEVLNLAAKMPAASNNSLPKWNGMTLTNMSQIWRDSQDLSVVYWKQEVQGIAKMGFNFLRVPLDYSFLFANDDTDQVNNAALKNIDNLLTWAIQNNIHVCFDLHTMPGSSTDSNDTNDTLFKDPAQQKILVRFWSFLAKRYAEIPSNALSFNLLNEPHGLDGQPLSDSNYSKVMLKVIDAIRAESPDRLIFVDMLDFGKTPVQGLVKSGVAQSMHYYLAGISGAYNHKTDYNVKVTWPLYLINGLVNKRNGPLTISGDFKTGTNVIFRLDGIHLDGAIKVKADGIEIGNYEFGKELIGENYCIQINEKGTGGENRSYDGAGFKFTLPAETKELSFELTGKSTWYYIRAISIENGPNTSLLYSQGDIVPDSSEKLVFHIAQDGSVTGATPKILQVLDSASIENRMKTIIDFSTKTGIQVMVQEFGIDSTSDYGLTIKVINEQLSVFNKDGLSWCLWGDGSDFWARNEDQKRVGATNKPFENHGWIATEMYDMIKTHMR